MSRLVLASASPRRRELLERVGIPVEVCPADVDETPLLVETPSTYALRVATVKASAVNRPEEWVLAADTVVDLDGQIFGKAGSPEEAAAMIRRLSGKTHRVTTAFVLVGPEAQERQHREVVTTLVTMVNIPDPVIADYVASGEWRGKAGAYAVQGIAAVLIAEVRGSITNVIGLPLAEVVTALVRLGGPTPHFAAGHPA
jgi:septum formation protein